MKRLSLFLLPALLTASCTRTVSTVEAEWADAPAYSVWKGERVHALAEVCSSEDISDVKAEVSSDEAEAMFVHEVIGDILTEKYDQCGPRKPGQYDSIAVADRIGPESVFNLEAGKAAKVWVSINVPGDAAAGTHRLTLKLKARGMKTVRLPLEYTVVDETLPEPKDWKFFLDLWQNPYSAARVYGVELWSEEHFARMKPLYKRLADAGQKTVTATIIDRPWNSQTEDPFGPMITKTLGEDGNWSYDYTVFDKWVEFMFSLGIDSKICCFSMIPWKLSFDYIDGATSETRFVEGGPGSAEYDGYWGPFLKDFASHLREKGWFEKTELGMDERPKKAMKACIGLIRRVEPDFKIFLAGVYNEDIQKELYDLCVAGTGEFPDSALVQRKKDGLLSTYYTCCAQKYPNTFLASAPQEAAWLGWLALSNGYDGYHRWSYNSWTASPETDARFRRWPAGDCYIVYPEASGVRFEHLREGIQDYEKATALRDRWTAEGDKAKLDSLAGVLRRISIGDLAQNGALEGLDAARKLISDLRQ